MGHQAMVGKSGKVGGRNSDVIIIRRDEVVEATSHNGAWKIAYADFVTAMMAFFLLMWLLNATTEDQRKGLADYFSPNNLLSHASSGTGQPFGGHTVFDQGAMVSDRGAEQVIVGKRPVVEDPAEDEADTQEATDPHGATAGAGSGAAVAAGRTTSGQSIAANPPGVRPASAKAAAANSSASNPLPTSPSPASPSSASSSPASPSPASPSPAAPEAAMSEAGKPVDAVRPPPLVPWTGSSTGARAPTAAEFRAEQERREKQAFEAAAEELRKAVQSDPALAEIARQLAIDITPEGLRIQLLDEERLAMFATGSAAPTERVRLLLAKVAPVLARLPEDIAVVGHTDAAPFAGSGRSNWELSTERANTTRRLLTDAGLAEARVSRVTGLADRDPLLPAEPLAAANRRIAIIVLRGARKPAEPPADAPAPPPAAPSIVTAPRAAEALPVAPPMDGPARPSPDVVSPEPALPMPASPMPSSSSLPSPAPAVGPVSPGPVSPGPASPGVASPARPYVVRRSETIPP